MPAGSSRQLQASSSRVAALAAGPRWLAVAASRGAAAAACVAPAASTLGRDSWETEGCGWRWKGSAGGGGGLIAGQPRCQEQDQGLHETVGVGGMHAGEAAL